MACGGDNFTFFCVVFVVCNVSLIVCVALCAVLFERDVLFCMMSVFFCVVSYCLLLPLGKNPFAVL
jgi:hypothetical protein